jgi:ATP-dependent helicase/DNAse subunit B
MYGNKLYLSSTSIQLFKSCKRRFKYKYIDKVSSGQKITSKYMSYGQSVHTAIAQFNMITDENYRTLEILHKLLRKNWMRDGFNDIEEEKKFGNKALRILEGYFKNPQDVGTKNLIVEGMIKKDLDSQFVLTGKIDRAFINLDDKIEITDYKTGDTIEHPDEFTLDPQLAIYAVLAEHKLKQFPQTISYYYLSHNKKVVRNVEGSYAQAIKDYLMSIVEEIRNERHYPCSPSDYCERTCEYYNTCDAASGYTSTQIIRGLQEYSSKGGFVTVF